MKAFLPSDEDFEVLLSALEAYKRETEAAIAVNQMMKKAKGIDPANEEAFIKAFSKPFSDIDNENLLSMTKAVRDKVLVVAAKLVQLRDHIREAKLNSEIVDLTK